MMVEPNRIGRGRAMSQSPGSQRMGLGRLTPYRKVEDGRFPRPARISIHDAGWRESAVSLCGADPGGYGRDAALSGGTIHAQ